MMGNLIKPDLYKALFNCTASAKQVKEWGQMLKSDCRAKMAGILHKNGELIASNSYIMTIVKSHYPETMEGQSINRKGEQLIGGYPTYRNVFPTDNSKYEPYTDSTTAQLLEACNLVPASPDMDNERIAIRFNEVLLYPVNVIKTLLVFEAVGETPELKTFGKCSENWSGLYLYSQNCEALVAGIYNYGGKVESYSVDEALTIDLL